MSSLVIIGAGGHGKVVLDAAIASGIWQDIAFVDDSEPAKVSCLGFPIVGTFAELLSVKEKPQVVVAIGNNQARLAKTKMLLDAGFCVTTVVHPAAIVSPFAQLGAGTVVFAGAVINPDVNIGQAVIVNSQVVIEHDCSLHDGVHISPNAALAGGVSVGSCSWVGIGACVIQQVSIGRDVMIGAGAAVTKSIPDGVTAVGVPAKVIKK